MTTTTGDRLVIAAPRLYHGLGNRVRSVLGAKSLAEHVERSFAYAWPIGKPFGARFSDLWDIADRTVSPAMSRLLALRYPYRPGDLEWLMEAESAKVWQIRTPHALTLPEGATPWGEQLRRLTPVDDLAERILHFRADHFGDEPYVGVMVRTHPVSHALTLEHSPVEWYVDRMREIREALPGVAFFVSSDTAQAQERIASDIGHTFFLQNKGDYNTTAALRSSIVDLYLLAGSGHILAPHYSSFPEIAQQLAGGEIRLETSMTPETPWRPGDDLTSPVDPLVPQVRSSQG